MYRAALVETATGKGIILAVVEDDTTARAIAGPLRASGYKVIIARDADSARLLAASFSALDLVIVDTAVLGFEAPRVVAAMRAARPTLGAVYLVADEATAPEGEPYILASAPPTALLPLVAEHAGRAVSTADRAAQIRARLLTRARSPELVAAFDAWREARADEGLPRVAPLGQRLMPVVDHLFIARAKRGAGGPFTFQFMALGQALRAESECPAEGAELTPAHEEIICALETAYEGATRTRLPSYESARYRLGADPPVTFERLLLPASADGLTVTHLFGVVYITGRPRNLDERSVALVR